VPSSEPARAPPTRRTRSRFEGTGALQDDAGEEAAKGLLGGEAENDGGEGAPDRERGRVDPGDAQRDDHDHRHRDKADEEAEGAGGGGVEPSVERR
jgi:hypothetical protein